MLNPKEILNSTSNLLRPKKKKKLSWVNEYNEQIKWKEIKNKTVHKNIWS